MSVSSVVKFSILRHVTVLENNLEVTLHSLTLEESPGFLRMHDVCGEIKASSKSKEFLESKELPKLNYKIIFKYFYSHRNAYKVGAYVHFFDCGEKENKKHVT